MVLGAISCGYLPMTSIGVLNAITVVTSHVLEIIFLGLSPDLVIVSSLVLTTLGVVVALIGADLLDPEYTVTGL